MEYIKINNEGFLFLNATQVEDSEYSQYEEELKTFVATLNELRARKPGIQPGGAWLIIHKMRHSRHSRSQYGQQAHSRTFYRNSRSKMATSSKNHPSNRQISRNISQLESKHNKLSDSARKNRNILQK